MFWKHCLCLQNNALFFSLRRPLIPFYLQSKAVECHSGTNTSVSLAVNLNSHSFVKFECWFRKKYISKSPVRKWSKSMQIWNEFLTLEQTHETYEFLAMKSSGLNIKATVASFTWVRVCFVRFFLLLKSCSPDLDIHLLASVRWCLPFCKYSATNHITGRRTNGLQSTIVSWPRA